MSAAQLVAKIRSRAGDEPVRLGLVLGSGLSGLADKLEGAVRIAYADLPGLPQVGVSGHRAEVIVGTLENVRLCVFGGRAHYYERGRADEMRRPLEVLAGLGGQAVFLANSAGAVNKGFAPGELMLITDHLNLTGANPLVGQQGDKRFIDMTHAYDSGLCDAMREAARAARLQLHEGVYAWFTGPSFETPAEIKMAGILGADAVGMSTVPEVIMARYLGLQVAAVSNMTNMAAGLSGGEISHEQTKRNAALAADNFEKLLRHFLRQLS